MQWRVRKKGFGGRAVSFPPLPPLRVREFTMARDVWWVRFARAGVVGECATRTSRHGNGSRWSGTMSNEVAASVQVFGGKLRRPREEWTRGRLRQQQQERSCKAVDRTEMDLRVRLERVGPASATGRVQRGRVRWGAAGRMRRRPWMTMWRGWWRTGMVADQTCCGRCNVHSMGRNSRRHGRVRILQKEPGTRKTVNRKGRRQAETRRRKRRTRMWARCG